MIFQFRRFFRTRTACCPHQYRTTCILYKDCIIKSVNCLDPVPGSSKVHVWGEVEAFLWGSALPDSCFGGNGHRAWMQPGGGRPLHILDRQLLDLAVSRACSILKSLYQHFPFYEILTCVRVHMYCSGQKTPDCSWGCLSEALGSWGSGNLEGGGFGEGLGQGEVSLQATWDQGGRILSQLGGFQVSRRGLERGTKGNQ